MVAAGVRLVSGVAVLVVRVIMAALLPEPAMVVAARITGLAPWREVVATIEMVVRMIALSPERAESRW